MVELLSACRRIPIEPPGGAAPPLGDPANPSYSVAVSNSEAQAEKERFKAEAEKARLFPVGKGLEEFLGSAGSSGVLTPAQAMIQAVTGRRGAGAGAGQGGIPVSGNPEAVVGARRSVDGFGIRRG
jgi:hypothetical protein